jgi:ABC-2 type transport system permease protein
LPSEVATDASGTAVRPAGARPRVGTGLFASELRVLFGRLRTRALLLVLAGVPVLIAVAVKLSTDPPRPGEGPPFLDRLTQNGLFAAITGLFIVMPFFLPLAVGVVAGDAISGEAGMGTLRYLLVVPAGRARLLVVKYAAVLVFCLVATFTVALVGLAIGGALFGLGDATLLSGDTVGLSTGLGRAALVAVYVAISMAGLGAIGVFISTMTDIAVGAMAGTVTLAIVSQILDSIPQVSAIHPYLFSHYWLSFGDLLRQPIGWHEVGRGLVLQAAYVAVFGSLAWARFTSRDVLA